jgi:hypothetical protein
LSDNFVKEKRLISSFLAQKRRESALKPAKKSGNFTEAKKSGYFSKKKRKNLPKFVRQFCALPNNFVTMSFEQPLVFKGNLFWHAYGNSSKTFQGGCSG